MGHIVFWGEFLFFCDECGDGTCWEDGISKVGTAHLNDSRAQYNLACCYELGVGVPADATLALHWYTKAVESGNADAQWRMGVAYRDGDFGLKPDKAEARHLLELSAAQGFETALEDLEQWT